MLIHTKKRVLVLKPRVPERILAVIPTAKQFEYKGAQLVAVPHKLDEVKVLRNMGIDAPSPILYYYEWPGQFKPFGAQKQTAAFLTHHNRSYVLSDMGTGKTQAILWAYDFMRMEKSARRMLVVGPLSTLERTWGDSIFDHFPHLTFQVLHGTRERRLRLLDQPADIYIVNHDGLKVIHEALAKRADIDLVVVDEIAQAGRNARTDRWKVLNTVVNKQKIVRACFGVTGTPTPNEPTDAWAQCRLITPETVPPYFNKFKDAVMRQVGPFRWVARDNALDVVHKAMQPAIRFSRKECIDLPPTVYTTRETRLTPEQDKAYKEMHSKLVAQMEAGEILAVNEAVKINKLLQICCGVAYGADGTEITIPVKPRLDLAVELIEESQSKTIVFVPFVSSTRVVAAHIRAAGYSVEVICGETSKHERDRIFAAFQRSKEPQVLVSIAAAMSHGLTLTSASTIIWYAPITSADIYDQANHRVIRPSQKLSTLIVNIEGSPVERKMYQRLRDKQSMQGILLDKMVGARDVLPA